jgi:hypothetical protein
LTSFNASPPALLLLPVNAENALEGVGGGGILLVVSEAGVGLVGLVIFVLISGSQYCVENGSMPQVCSSPSRVS